MSKKALIGAILASSASLGLAVSGKCGGNSVTATNFDVGCRCDPNSPSNIVFKFDCGAAGAGYKLKGSPQEIDATGSTDLAVLKTTCCDAVAGKCGGNAATATDLASPGASHNLLERFNLIVQPAIL